MRARRALLVVPIVLAVMAAPGLAAPKAAPQISDPKGDSLAGQAALDIVSVLYATTGTGSGKGYQPKKLVVTLTLAGPPSTTGVVTYRVVADTDGCGLIDLRWAPGNATGTVIGDTYAKFGSCAEAIFFFPKVQGSVVTFEVGLKVAGIDRGTVFSDFVARVDASDPAVAEFGTGNTPAAGVGDSATGDGTWIVP